MASKQSVTNRATPYIYAAVELVILGVRPGGFFEGLEPVVARGLRILAVWAH